MEFFDWMSIPQVFLQYFMPNFATLEANLAYLRNLVFISMGIAGGLYLIAHVLGGFGLLKMSKRAGIKYGWIGFLPLGNTILSGKLAGETRVFGLKMKRVGIYAAIAEVFFIAVGVLSLILYVKFLNVAYFTEIYNAENVLPEWEFSNARVPLPLRNLSLATDILSIVSELVLIFFFCILYFAFFRKYYARSPFLMTFLCAVLPVRGFVLFAVRNNTPVDYNAYMQRRMQEYQNRQNPYGNSGGQGNPYDGAYGSNGQGNPYGSNGQRPPEEPFPDYGNGENDTPSDTPNPPSDSPFDDFN